jgi:predicted nucleotidyltransferase component of viral defense system
MTPGKTPILAGIDDNPVLTGWQKRFLREFVRSDLRETFRLAGGTALSAFYLHHRDSEDLDFFSGESVPMEALDAFLQSLDFVQNIRFFRRYDRRIFTLELPDGNPLKTEFTRYSLPDLEPPVEVGGLLVESFQDIVVGKLCAVADRSEIKDYVDLYVATRDNPDSLWEWCRAAEIKCQIAGIQHILESRLLQIPEGIETLAMRTELSPQEMTETWTRTVRRMIDRRIASMRMEEDD